MSKISSDKISVHNKGMLVKRKEADFRLELIQNENKVNLMILECDIYSFIRGFQDSIKNVSVDLETKRAEITFKDMKYEI